MRSSGRDRPCEPVPCLLCDELAGLRPVAHRPDGVACHVVICPNDGLVFLSPRWTREEYERFYHDRYDGLCRESVLQPQDDEQKFARAKEIRARLSEADLLAGRRRMLDVGAGMGWVLEYLSRELPDSHCSAIEPSDHCARHIGEQLGYRVISRDAETDWSHAHAGEFQLVIMRHVLEHTLDPITVLRKVREALAEDGVVYLAVPNMMHPHGSLLTYWYRGEHTYYFSPGTLTAVAGRAGLVATAVEGHGSELWSVFTKVTAQDQVQVGSQAYRDQMKVLRRYQYRSRLIDLWSAAGRLMPRRLHSQIRRLLPLL